jgi:hypothetical protein
MAPGKFFPIFEIFISNFGANRLSPKATGALNLFCLTETYGQKNFLGLKKTFLFRGTRL